MRLGSIGLGKMGSRMVVKLLEGGHEVVVWNRSQKAIDSIKYQVLSIKSYEEKVIHNTYYIIHNTNQGKLSFASTIEELVKRLDKPRIIWIMVPAGATQEIIDEISKYVEEGDIVVDGGNSYYKDTESRYKELKTKNIKYLGVGVSGGILAAENGFPLMVGGDKSAYEYIQPILKTLSKPGGGYDYFGAGGAGHFIKMVHNGIEYGIMQSLGEGFGILEKSQYALELDKVSRLWQKGTLVSGFLLDRASDALTKNPKLSDIEGHIEESGEARWTIESAKEENVPVKVIEDSLQFRLDSEKDEKIKNSYAARLIAALRREFGGHKVKEKNN